MADISTRLYDLIESRGISQTWLAEKAGATEATISRCVNGKTKPNLDVAIGIAKTLNVSLDYLAGLTLNPSPYHETDKDIVILCNAYGRADETRRNIIWAALEPFLTPEEKTFIWPSNADESVNEDENVAV